MVRYLGQRPFRSTVVVLVCTQKIDCSTQGRNHWGGGSWGSGPPQNLEGPSQLFWWRVWLPLRNRLQCTKLCIPSVFCSVQ